MNEHPPGPRAIARRRWPAATDGRAWPPAAPNKPFRPAGAAARRADRRARPRCARRRPLSAGGSADMDTVDLVESAGRGGGRQAPDPLPARPGPARHPPGPARRPSICKIVGRPGWPPSTCSAQASAEILGDQDAAIRPLDAWGDYDRGRPVTRLFAQVQEDDPVHEVTPGRRAPRVADRPPRGSQCRSEPTPGLVPRTCTPRLPPRDGPRWSPRGLPGPRLFARHMLSVDPPDHTRLRRLTSAAFSRPRIACPFGHVSRRSSTRLA